ncbi:hypothetical protein FRC12_002645 [Ceratobasidium sp. 428]|nr:hypothetical protein FRC12_002645 [Ceratobasidium sp. 428]
MTTKAMKEANTAMTKAETMLFLVVPMREMEVWTLVMLVWKVRTFSPPITACWLKLNRFHSLELADRDVEIGLDDAGSASDDDPLPDRPHGAVEDYASVRGTVHNPPMIYVEWHEPPVDEADDSEDEGEDEDNIERDPAYVEHDVPLGLNPLDESGLRDEDVQGMLELDLEDSAAEEWDGMYARYISRRTWTPKKTLPSLSKPRVNWKYEHGVQAFSREVIYPEFPTVVLGTPIRRVPLEQPLTSHLARCFGHFSPEQNTTQVTERIEADSMIRYGRLRLAGDGDRIRTAALVDNDPIARDKSFIKARSVFF